MSEVILYMAVSSDGFIADHKGGVNWLDKYNAGPEDYGYKKFYNSIDALVMGKNTYEQMLTFGPWSFPEKSSYVFADVDTKSCDKNVHIVADGIPTFMRTIEESGIARLWLVGGAQLAQSFDELGLIDEHILSITPDRLGKGVPLPKHIFRGENFRLIDSIIYPISEIIQKHYVRRN